MVSKSTHCGDMRSIQFATYGCHRCLPLANTAGAKIQTDSRTFYASSWRRGLRIWPTALLTDMVSESSH